MSLSDAIVNALAQGEKLTSAKAANEANTKALLIEPMLNALGWNPFDLDVVQREVKVYDGTFLDYALKHEGTARIYVEAKALGENLADPKFVAQAVNYANNDGVLWCVLTNGWRWQAYKTNEPVAMDRKLLFEVDTSDAAGNLADSAKALSLVSRDRVLAGDLDRLAERTFTDGRVRSALAKIATSTPDVLLKLVADQLGQPAVADEALLRSLRRVLDAEDLTPGAASTASIETSSGLAATPSPPKGQEYSLDHHLDGKSALMAELFNEVNAFGMAIGADTTRRVRKFYVGYFRGKKSFFTVELQKQRVLAYLGLDPGQTEPWNAHSMRDVTDIGHYGMGNVEYSLNDTGQLDEICQLIQLAYDRAG
jgi:predicted transport protein